MDDLNVKVDDLGRRVDNGFNRVDAKIEKQAEMTAAEFAAVRLEMREGFQRVDERFERLHQLMLRSSVVVIAALIALVATQL
jgi:site-specific recombinase